MLKDGDLSWRGNPVRPPSACDFLLMSDEPDRAFSPERRKSPRPPATGASRQVSPEDLTLSDKEADAEGPGGPLWLAFVLVGIAATVWLAGVLLDLW